MIIFGAGNYWRGFKDEKGGIVLGMWMRDDTRNERKQKNLREERRIEEEESCCFEWMPWWSAVAVPVIVSVGLISVQSDVDRPGFTGGGRFGGVTPHGPLHNRQNLDKIGKNLTSLALFVTSLPIFFKLKFSRQIQCHNQLQSAKLGYTPPLQSAPGAGPWCLFGWSRLLPYYSL